MNITQNRDHLRWKVGDFCVISTYFYNCSMSLCIFLDLHLYQRSTAGHKGRYAENPTNRCAISNSPSLFKGRGGGMGPDLKYAELLDIVEDYVQKHNLSRNKASPPGVREGERGGGSLLKARDFCHPYKDNYCYAVQPKQLHKIIIWLFARYMV